MQVTALHSIARNGPLGLKVHTCGGGGGGGGGGYVSRAGRARSRKRVPGTSTNTQYGLRCMQ
jgi:hypothetical protein